MSNGAGHFKRRIQLRKRDEEKRLVYGVVYEPDVLDGDSEYTDAEEIRKAAHEFLSRYRTIGIMHKYAARDVELVESYIAPSNLDIDGMRVRKGGWVIAVHVKDDALWKAIKEGQFTGFSMGGRTERVAHASEY